MRGSRLGWGGTPSSGGEELVICIPEARLLQFSVSPRCPPPVKSAIARLLLPTRLGAWMGRSL